MRGLHLWSAEHRGGGVKLAIQVVFLEYIRINGDQSSYAKPRQQFDDIAAEAAAPDNSHRPPEDTQLLGNGDGIPVTLITGGKEPRFQSYPLHLSHGKAEMG